MNEFGIPEVIREKELEVMGMLLRPVTGIKKNRLQSALQIALMTYYNATKGPK